MNRQPFIPVASSIATVAGYGLMNNPQIAMELERNTSKVNVWLGLTQQRIYGPFFFAERQHRT